MVNKRRPRKVRPPYKRFGPETGSSYELTLGIKPRLPLTIQRLEAEFHQVTISEGEAEGEGDCEEPAEEDSHSREESSDLSYDEGDDKIASVEKLASKNDVITGNLHRTLDSRGVDQRQDDVQHKQKPLVYLPPEIISLVFQYICSDDNELFPLEVLFVCKSWYHTGLKFLYECPELRVENYQRFVDTISSSDYLGRFVKILDLRNIIQSGKNSFTARLLRRCSTTLETFIAPQTSFGYAPLMSLRQCKNLHTLDLSLVSEAVDLRELFSAIANAHKLERLEFPRSSVFCQDYDFEWPANLKHLGLSGGITNDFINRTSFPMTIKWLSFSHCPFIGTTNVRNLTYRLGPHLTSLTVIYPMPALNHNTLDSVLRICPNLKSLCVSVDYITKHVFDDANLELDVYGQFKPHPLVNLALDSSGMLGLSHKLEVDDITLALLENKLPELKYLRVSAKLGWVTTSEDVEDLVSILEPRNGGLWVY